MSTDLHHECADVDHFARPRTLFAFLVLVNSLPEVREYKRLLHTELHLQPGNTLLDVGCGTGIEACRIANERPDASVNGLDCQAMIAEAQG